MATIILTFVRVFCSYLNENGTANKSCKNSWSQIYNTTPNCSRGNYQPERCYYFHTQPIVQENHQLRPFTAYQLNAPYQQQVYYQPAHPNSNPPILKQRTFDVHSSIYYSQMLLINYHFRLRQVFAHRMHILAQIWCSPARIHQI